MRILIAPDKFKGSRGAPEVARAMAVGARRAFPGASVTLLPLADGGEGTVAALLEATGGTVQHVRVAGPLGDPVEAPLGRLRDGRAVLEMAAASGLALVPEPRRNALHASSRGTGELIRAALESARPGRDVLVGIGGSASTDGGTGAATAIGWRFLDARGRELGPGGGHLVELRRIDGAYAELVDHGRVVGASDVGNPLLGARGAAHTFAPQKGASPGEVEVLERGLATLAARIRADLGADVAERWGAGACGGMGAGLLAFFSAELRPGFDVVAEAAGLAERLSECDLVVTGEGRLDAQSLAGKTPVGVARAASSLGVDCEVVAGQIALSAAELWDAGFKAAASLVDEVGPRAAVDAPDAAIATATERLLRRSAS